MRPWDHPLRRCGLGVFGERTPTTVRNPVVAVPPRIFRTLALYSGKPRTSAPSITDMFQSVHGGRSLHYGAKRTYLALCKTFPGHGIPLRVIQDLVAECPTCQKDRIPMQLVPHNNIRETLMHHKRTIGIDHVTVTPPDEDGYVGISRSMGRLRT